MDDLPIYQSADDEKKNCDCEAGTETVKRDTKNRNCACKVAIRVRRWLVFCGDAVCESLFVRGGTASAHHFYTTYLTGGIPGINKQAGETITTRFSLARGFEEMLKDGERERDLPAKKSGISFPGFRDDLFFFFIIFFFFFFETHLSPTTSSWIHPVEHNRLALARNEKPSKWCVRLSQVRAVDCRRSSGRFATPAFSHRRSVAKGQLTDR